MVIPPGVICGRRVGDCARKMYGRHRAPPPTGPAPSGPAVPTSSMERIGMLLGIIGIGPLEMVIVAVIILLLFGNRLPGVMRSMGQGLVEFKKGMQGIEDQNKEGANKK